MTEANFASIDALSFENKSFMPDSSFFLIEAAILQFTAALYLVLARRNNAAILTLDHRLADLAQKLEIEIIG